MLTQGLIFVIMAAFPQPFIGVENANVAQFWTQSRIPRNYFYVLVFQFVLIILDRLIYLYQVMIFPIIDDIFAFWFVRMQMQKHAQTYASARTLT